MKKLFCGLFKLLCLQLLYIELQRKRTGIEEIRIESNGSIFSSEKISNGVANVEAIYYYCAWICIHKVIIYWIEIKTLFGRDLLYSERFSLFIWLGTNDWGGQISNEPKCGIKKLKNISIQGSCIFLEDRIEKHCFRKKSDRMKTRFKKPDTMWVTLF